MKIACLGDLHGVDRWKEAMDLGVDHFLFVGDYVDSHVLEDKNILKNLVEVIEFKISQPDHVTLLLGNHDVHYLYYPHYRCSGFRESMLDSLHSIFSQNEALFKVAAGVDNYLFTHAGITSYWANQYLDISLDNPVEIVNSINRKLSDQKSRDELVTVGSRRGGFEPFGGPIWCDYNELIQDPLLGYNQIVGHTMTYELVDNSVKNTRLINVDYLAYSDVPIFVLEADNDIFM